MALDFPPGTPGATYTGPNGVIWSWDGAKWLAGTGTTVYAPVTDAALQGQPTAPTPPAGDADTSIATTAFVTNAVATSLHDVGRNYLHNSMFNVAQRGVGAFTTLGTYTLDRWMLSGVTDTVSITQAAFGDAGRAAIGDEAATFAAVNTFTGNAGATAYHYVRQPIEKLRRLSGKTVTLSFWATASSALKLGVNYNQSMGTGGSPSAGAWNNNTGQSVQLSTVWARYSVTTDIVSASGKTLGTNGDDSLMLGLFFSSGANTNALAGNIGVQAGTIQLWGVQLELGPTATPLEKLDPVTQLQQCQRFFLAGTVTFWGYQSAGASYGNTYLLPVVMRANPSNPTFAPVGNVNVGAVTSGITSPGSIYFWATATATGPVTVNGTFTTSADL